MGLIDRLVVNLAGIKQLINEQLLDKSEDNLSVILLPRSKNKD